MITKDILEKLARQYQTAVFPNIVREYLQHVFMAELYRLPDSEQLLFKGGTALRIIYGSPRFSEDLDFSLTGIRPPRIQSFVEGLMIKVLTEIERNGIHVEIGSKSGTTSGGYFGVASFKISGFPPVGIQINVSTRSGKQGPFEMDTVVNDFIPAYTLVHLSQKELVEEKIFGALLQRKKPRDFYDLYFIMRKGLLLPDQKKRLAALSESLLVDAKKINFKGELGAFLPANQQLIIRDFPKTLLAELSRQTGSREL